MNEEDPFPTRRRDDAAADDRSEPQPYAENNAPPGEGRTPGSGALKLVGENGDLADQHDAARDALEETSADQDGDVMGDPAHEGGQAEGDHADQKQTLAAKAIGQGACSHQHGGDRDRIGVHDPLELDEVGAERAFKRGQDDRHAGNLQAEHQG